ncbi:MAG: hypothetical protein F8N39_07230 [Clostridiaceae bacterium]|nr:hypothetical protein [Clostridiaceae bacterium]
MIEFDFPKIDRCRAGMLVISDNMIAWLLGIFPSHATYNDEYSILRFVVEGEDMPPYVDGTPLPEVKLVCREERDEQGNVSIFVHWDHLPTKEWKLR